MSPHIYEDYKQTLRAFFSMGKARSGLKSEFSKAVGIQPSFLSQVLFKNAQLSSDQSFLACEFMGLSERETQYFLISLQLGKCKEVKLQNFFKNQLQALQKSSQQPKLTSDIRRKYFSKWYYTAIIRLLEREKGISEVNAASQLKLPIGTCREALQFLRSCHFVREADGSWVPGRAKVIEPESPEERKSFSESCRLKTLEPIPLSQSFSSIQNFKDTEAIEKVVTENIKALLAGSSQKLSLLQIDLVPIV